MVIWKSFIRVFATTGSIDFFFKYIFILVSGFIAIVVSIIVRVNHEILIHGNIFFFYMSLASSLFQDIFGCFYFGGSASRS
jgi:hypothetical protein